MNGREARERGKIWVVIERKQKTNNRMLLLVRNNAIAKRKSQNREQRRQTRAVALQDVTLAMRGKQGDVNTSKREFRQ